MAGGLMFAVRECYFQQVQYILKSGLSIDYRDVDGKNAVVHALEIPDEKN